MKAIAVMAILSIVGNCYAGLPIVSCKSVNDIKVTEISLFNSTWICEKEPCVVYKGHNVSINISFENVGATDITKLTNDVYGIFLGITVPFPNFNPEMKNVCNLLQKGSLCPIKKGGGTYTEKVIVLIPDIAISGMKVVAKWQLMNDKLIEGCFEVELEIQ